MNTPFGKAALSATLATALLLGAGTASAGVTVNYVNPDNFSDLPMSSYDRDEVLRELARHFDKLGKKLPAGHDLAVEITDIDLAGREYPTRRAAGEVRILRGNIDWPVIDLRYTISANGQVIDSGATKLRDMDYLNRHPRHASWDGLRYEKTLIDDWFGKTVLQNKPS